MDPAIVRVLHIASGDLWAGAEVMLHSLVHAQKRLPTIQVSVIVLNEGELASRLRALAVPTFVLPESQLGLFRLCREGRRVVQMLRPDIIHTHRIKEDLVGMLASIGCSVKRIRTVHGVDEAVSSPASFRRRAFRAIHMACVRRLIHFTVAVSQPLATELSNVLGVDRVAYVANGYGEVRSPVAASRASTSRPRVLGVVGRLVPVKRIDLFLEMAAILQQSAPESFEFRVIGDGPDRAKLECLAQRLGIAHCVRFTGFVQSVAEAMAMLDALYVTSDSEGLPMVVLEAMALRVPIIAHAVGEIPVVLDGGRCGVLIDRHEPLVYAEAALRFLETPMDLRARADAALLRVHERYSAESCAEAYLRHYQSLLMSAKFANANARP